MQLNKEKNIVQLDRQRLARIFAQSFNRQAYIGRKIVQSERSWMRYRVIPSTMAGGHKTNLSWMEDEDLILSVKDWACESKYYGQCRPTSNVKILPGLTSYLLARFVGEYLLTHHELAPYEIDTQEELERSILCGSTIRSDGKLIVEPEFVLE